jgi:hypothetical protein
MKKGTRRLNPIRFDERELKTDMGEGNFIFVGSSIDMWAFDNGFWIEKVLGFCKKFDNHYFFQTKNPGTLSRFVNDGWGYQNLPEKSSICLTLETNKGIEISNAISPVKRAMDFADIRTKRNKHVTIEPIMDFDLNIFIDIIKHCKPYQVNIGGDSKGHNLPEPPKSKVMELIKELGKFTKVHQKTNLKRILNS